MLSQQAAAAGFLLLSQQEVHSSFFAVAHEDSISEAETARKQRTRVMVGKGWSAFNQRLICRSGSPCPPWEEAEPRQKTWKRRR